jgi:hypothetical protein
MRMTVIRTQTERKRQDRSVRRDEKRRCRASTLRIRGPIHRFQLSVRLHTALRAKKRLTKGQNQAILT